MSVLKGAIVKSVFRSFLKSVLNGSILKSDLDLKELS